MIEGVKGETVMVMVCCDNGILEQEQKCATEGRYIGLKISLKLILLERYACLKEVLNNWD